MAAIKFSKQYIEPNPNEIDYWVDLSSNQYGGRMKYYNGFEWVDLVNPDGTHIDINDFYNKLQINQMLSQKASVDSVESKVDDDEVSDVIKNISFSQRGEDGVEMVMFKYDDTTVGIQLPIADNTKSGIITKDTFKNLVNLTQLQQLYSEMYTKLSEIRNNYQPKLRAGANIKIENNVISAVSKISTDWNDIANKPDIYDKSQVDTMMSGVYKIKGSRTFEELPTEGNNIGDTYNITNSFTLNGEEYELGTNVVWTEEGWDALAGIFDTSELEEDIQEVKDNYLPKTGNAATATQLKINEFELNDDLNDFINDGVYVSTRTNVVGSLLNIPDTVVKGEARLDVKTFGSSRHLKQTLNLKNQNYQRVFYRFKYANEWSEWKQIATTDSNVASATKLATPIKLWGADIDGTQNYGGSITLMSNTAINGTTEDGKVEHCLIPRWQDGKTYFNFGSTGLVVRNNNSDIKMVISPDGNVGIGTTNPLYKLEVNDTARIGSFVFHHGNEINTYKDYERTQPTNLHLNYRSSGEVTIAAGGGNVGIGTNYSPQYKLEVNGATHIKQGDVNTTFQGTLINFYNTKNKSGFFLYPGANPDNALSLDTANENGANLLSAVRISKQGNVGIKVNDPRYTLEVGGTATISGYTIIKDSLSIWNSLAVSNKIASGDLVDWYGVSWSEDSSDPTCTRIGNMALHRSLPIQSAMQGYLIQRPIDFILPLTSNWEKSKYDEAHNNGANISSYGNSNVMVKIPEFWYTDDYEPSTKTHNLKISQTAKAGWCHHKEAYVGAYEGCINEGQYKSIKGKIPTVSVNRETIRTAARANGYEDEYKWNIYTYEEHRAICHLFLVEYATRNSQLAVNPELTADGFKQGGLGSGCTTGTVTVNGVTTYSFIPTGTTDSLGNGSGQVAYTVTQTDADGNEIGTVTRYANRYRGIENPFGHIWKHVDDVVNVYNAETTYKTVYKCNKPEHFATNKNAKYKSLCSFPGGSKMIGWSKEIKATINCDFFKYSVGGSESTYWCDYNYDNDDTSQHCLLIGGCSGDSGKAGLFIFFLNYGVGTSLVSLGSRLTYLPWAE